jgi:hypothetical protein
MPKQTGCHPSWVEQSNLVNHYKLSLHCVHQHSLCPLLWPFASPLVHYWPLDCLLMEKEVVVGEEEVMWGAVVDMYLLEECIDRFRIVVVIADLKVHRQRFKAGKKIGVN